MYFNVDLILFYYRFLYRVRRFSNEIFSVSIEAYKKSFSIFRNSRVYKLREKEIMKILRRNLLVEKKKHFYCDVTASWRIVNRDLRRQDSGQAGLFLRVVSFDGRRRAQAVTAEQHCYFYGKP